MDHFTVLPDMDDTEGLDHVLAALRAPARPHELAGEAGARTAFTAAVVAMAAKEKTATMEKALRKEKGNIYHLPRHLGPKVGAATAVALLGFTGAAAAAVTGNLPAPVQSFVHARLGAVPAPATKAPTPPLASRGTSGTPTSPAPSPTAVPTPVGSSSVPGVGPSAGGAAAAGLCHAFASKGASPASHSAAARNLAAAAAAASQSVEAFCAPYLATDSDASGSSDSHGSHGKPTSGPASSAPNGHDPHASAPPGKGHGRH